MFSLWVPYQFAKVLGSTSSLFSFHSPLVFSIYIFSFISAGTYGARAYSLAYIWAIFGCHFLFILNFRYSLLQYLKTHSRSPRLTRPTLHCLAFVYCIAATVATWLPVSSIVFSHSIQNCILSLSGLACIIALVFNLMHASFADVLHYTPNQQWRHSLQDTVYISRYMCMIFRVGVGLV